MKLIVYVPHLNPSIHGADGVINNPWVDHFVTIGLFLEANVSSQTITKLAKEEATFVLEVLGKHIQVNDHFAFRDERVSAFAIQAVPVALFRVAPVIAVTIRVITYTVLVERGVTLSLLLRTVEPIVKTLGRIAIFVAVAIVERLPAFDGH